MRYFHGTTLPGLTEIEPASMHGQAITFPCMTSKDHAYATSDESTAWHYAELAWNAADAGVPRVYEVEPTGEVEPDPNEEFSSDVRSRAPFTVIRELPMPERMGNPDDWR